MKKLLAIVAALFLTLTMSQAYVDITDIEVNPVTGDVILTIDADEPWALYISEDLWNWELLKKQGAGRKVFIDRGRLFLSPEGYYDIQPVRKQK